MTNLVRPSEIAAADSKDLEQALLLANSERIDERTNKRDRDKWVVEQCDKIRSQYESRARDIYEKLWKRCKNSYAGHAYRNHDSGGHTVKVCTTCGKTSCDSRNGEVDYDFKYRSEQAESMNDALIRSMRDRMIELDLEAGVLTWPTEDDYRQKRFRRK